MLLYNPKTFFNIKQLHTPIESPETFVIIEETSFKQIVVKSL